MPISVILFRSCLGSHIDEISWDSMIFLEDTISQQASCSSVIYNLSVPSSTIIPEPYLLRCRSCVVHVPVGAGYHTISTSLYIASLYFSMLVSLCCKEKFLWQGMRNTLVCRHMDKYLEYNFRLCNFIKVEIVAFTPWSMIHLLMSSWLSFQYHKYHKWAESRPRALLITTNICLPLLYT